MAIHKDEKIWFILALIWMIVSFLYMPIQHVIGKQNPPTESYRVSAEDFDALLDGMIEKYQVGEENGIPVVHPNPDEPVYLRASMWEWTPVLELEKGKTYKLHMSSPDLQHGFSLQPVNLNLMVIPGIDYIVNLKPTSAGDFRIICNEYCGVGHHTMVGKITVI
jgi:cytochrome c oxidase subunit II